MAKENITLDTENRQEPDFTSNLSSIIGRMSIIGDLGELDVTYPASIKLRQTVD